MKISTDKIKGFAEMSDADKVAALLSLDVPDPVDMSQFVEKKVFDAKATEASNLSKQLKAKMSDEEAKAAKEAEERAAMEKELASLRKEKPSEPTKPLIWNWATTRKQRRKTPKLSTPEILRKYFPIRRNLSKRRKRPRQPARLTSSPGFPAGTQ